MGGMTETTMKETKRAERRHHNRRLLKKRYKEEVRQSYRVHDSAELEACKRRARYRLDTSARCSCEMCRNPRRNGGFASVTGKVETFQELRANNTMQDGLEDFEESA